MVAEMQRLEDAARTAMGDYSHFIGQPVIHPASRTGFVLIAAKAVEALGRVLGGVKAAA